MAEPLPNPEQFWTPHADLLDVTSEEIAQRIGARPDAWTLLSGGRANANVLIDGRVLRIYRRDPLALPLEAALLRRSWTSFRVPTILATGADFMLLEYVSHGPVLGSAEHGAAVGRALAEIHALSFEQAGFLTPGLDVREPFPDLVTSLIDYTRSRLPAAEEALGHEQTAAVLHALESNASGLRAAAGSPVLLHADFKASNLHWAEDGRLLVLDWEFAYSGSHLSDIGQLLRWTPPEAFVRAFANGYGAAGRALSADFRQWAALLDLANLVGLAAKPFSVDSQPRLRDLSERIALTLAPSRTPDAARIEHFRRRMLNRALTRG